MGTKRQTHTDVALFALWLSDNAQELRKSPRTAEAVQKLYHSDKQNGAGQVGLPAIKKLSKALEIPLAKIQRVRGEYRTSKRTDRVILEIKNLSEKLEALAKHVLTLTDDVKTVDGVDISEFGITEGLKSLVNRKADPVVPLQDQEKLPPTSTIGVVPKWGMDNSTKV